MKTKCAKKGPVALTLLPLAMDYPSDPEVTR